MFIQWAKFQFKYLSNMWLKSKNPWLWDNFNFVISKKLFDDFPYLLLLMHSKNNFYAVVFQNLQHDLLHPSVVQLYCV